MKKKLWWLALTAVILSACQDPERARIQAEKAANEKELARLDQTPITGDEITEWEYVITTWGCDWARKDVREAAFILTHDNRTEEATLRYVQAIRGASEALRRHCE